MLGLPPTVGRLATTATGVISTDVPSRLTCIRAPGRSPVAASRLRVTTAGSGLPVSWVALGQEDAARAGRHALRPLERCDRARLG